ncbi:hypothetical protein BJX61DRAFT_113 [Aspergillus egyptiacus]|nr:hypothetical protein BJX61DRAFT_113 [Aspergillus egyptiacus]
MKQFNQEVDSSILSGDVSFCFAFACRQQNWGQYSLLPGVCLSHTTTGCGEQGFPSAQPYLSHTPVG